MARLMTPAMFSREAELKNRLAKAQRDEAKARRKLEAACKRRHAAWSALRNFCIKMEGRQ